MSSFIEINSKSVHTVDDTDMIQTISSATDDVAIIGQDVEMNSQRVHRMQQDQRMTSSSVDIVISDSEDEGLKWGRGERGQQIIKMQTPIDFDADFVSLVPLKRPQAESVEEEWHRDPKERRNKVPPGGEYINPVDLSKIDVWGQ